MPAEPRWAAPSQVHRGLPLNRAIRILTVLGLTAIAGCTPVESRGRTPSSAVRAGPLDAQAYARFVDQAASHILRSLDTGLAPAPAELGRPVVTGIDPGQGREFSEQFAASMNDQLGGLAWFNLLDDRPSDLECHIEFRNTADQGRVEFTAFDPRTGRSIARAAAGYPIPTPVAVAIEHPTRHVRAARTFRAAPGDPKPDASEAFSTQHRDSLGQILVSRRRPGVRVHSVASRRTWPTGISVGFNIRANHSQQAQVQIVFLDYEDRPVESAAKTTVVRDNSRWISFQSRQPGICRYAIVVE